mmetsp:Transcript_18488/g.40018  ORF Transcript_18488/g.40018 Transcript_18488/m.40018 type:complete len:129 (-) Transcript_18488:807-1193(-)
MGRGYVELLPDAQRVPKEAYDAAWGNVLRKVTQRARRGSADQLIGLCRHFDYVEYRMQVAARQGKVKAQQRVLIEKEKKQLVEEKLKRANLRHEQNQRHKQEKSCMTWALEDYIRAKQISKFEARHFR